MKKKKILGISLTIIIAIISTISSIYSDTYWSDTGWYASNGYNSYPGKAYDRHSIPGGWAFKCKDDGICYTISGGSFTVNDAIGSVEGGYIDVKQY